MKIPFFKVFIEKICYRYYLQLTDSISCIDLPRKIIGQKISCLLIMIFITHCSTIQQEINEYAYQGNLPALKKGLQNLKAINIQDDRGWTPLMAAVENNKKEIVIYLLNEGAYIDLRNDSGDTALMRAVYMDHPDMITLLLDKGADRGIRAKNGYTPFLKACEKGKLEIAKLLYRENVDIKD